MGCGQSSAGTKPAVSPEVETADGTEKKAPEKKVSVTEKKEEEKPKPAKVQPNWPILEVGKQAIVAREGGFVGTIVKSTTTEVQLKTRDGKEDWYETEEVMIYGDRSPPDSKVLQKGAMVTTRNGVKGELKEKTTTEVCLKVISDGEDNETSKWVAVEDIVFLRVHIVRANNLRNADTFSLSDPYCICELTGKPKSKVRTEFVSDDLNPRWDYQTSMICYEHEKDEIKFTIYDADLIKSDDLLGIAVLTKDQLIDRDGFVGFAGDLPLKDGDGNMAQGSVTIKVVVENCKPEPVEPPPKVPEQAITIESERQERKAKSCC